MIRLTTEQQRVIDSPAKHKLIEAVAGSGKTTLCVRQLGAWFKEGASPSETAVITFTRRAAESIRAKVRRAYGVELGFSGTFHGMAYLCMALACDGRYRLTPLTDEECDALVDHVAASLKMTRSITPKVRKVPKGEEPGAMTQREQTLATAVTQYMSAMRLIHVGLLVERFANTLIYSPELREWFQSRCRNLVVDEAQDMNSSEALIYSLACPSRSMVVGDPRQSIYRFRGADPRLFTSLFEDGEAFSISYNFRSGSRILDAANALWDSSEIPLVPFRDTEGTVESYPTSFEKRVTDQIAELMCGRPGPVHVLCRYNQEIRWLDDSLVKVGIEPTIISPAFDRFSKPIWKRLFMACRIAMDPRCDWLSTAASMIGAPIHMFLEIDLQTITARDVLDLYSKEDSLELANEDKLDMSVPEFVAWYQRRDLQDLVTAVKEGVVLMTAHASKGLEFNTVCLCDVGNTLGQRRKTEEETLEEKNLLHVAITRAKNGLIMIGPGDFLASLKGGGVSE